MSLKGSKTEQNLKDAFAGESQANRRYLYFAAKADIEGYNDVSTVFLCGANGADEHAGPGARDVVDLLEADDELVDTVTKTLIDHLLHALKRMGIQETLHVDSRRARLEGSLLDRELAHDRFPSDSTLLINTSSFRTPSLKL